jgi:hypothetical protein
MEGLSMTDEELIARLRLYGSKFHHDFGHNDAADRIEALTEQLAAAQHDAKEAEAYAEEVERELRDTQDRANAFATKEYYTEMRAERAEAKLAKVVELLILCRDMFDEVDHPSDPLSVMLNETLAEIKGESHE